MKIPFGSYNPKGVNRKKKNLDCRIQNYFLSTKWSFPIYEGAKRSFGGGGRNSLIIIVSQI